jgi:DNA-binding response OmpR family regulator
MDVLSKLREMDPNVRVIIVSADIQSSTRTMAKEGGACALINKPLVASEVLEVLKGALVERNP